MSQSTTVFVWWPWTPSSTTQQSTTERKNLFNFRCSINRQCTSIDNNSHCTLFGRCVCNVGYRSDTTNKEQKCVRKIINEKECD
jgi:hypothetical protein